MYDVTLVDVNEQDKIYEDLVKESGQMNFIDNESPDTAADSDIGEEIPDESIEEEMPGEEEDAPEADEV